MRIMYDGKKFYVIDNSGFVIAAFDTYKDALQFLWYNAEIA